VYDLLSATRHHDAPARSFTFINSVYLERGPSRRDCLAELAVRVGSKHHSLVVHQVIHRRDRWRPVGLFYESDSTEVMSPEQLQTCALCQVFYGILGHGTSARWYLGDHAALD